MRFGAQHLRQRLNHSISNHLGKKMGTSRLAGPLSRGMHQRFIQQLRRRARFKFTPSNRTLVLLVIISSWLMVIGLGRVLPWASALMLLFGIMLGYFSLVSIRLFRGHAHSPNIPDPPADTANEPVLPHVSVVVAAHNEATVIGRMVENLAQLTYPNMDVVIMDDRSTDGTAEAAQERIDQLLEVFSGKNLPEMRVVKRPVDATPGKSAVLNDALLITEGELLAVFDADASVLPDFLDQLVPFFQNPSVGGVQARKVVGNPATNLLTRCQYFEMAMDTYIQAGRDTIGGAVEFRGNGEIVRREAVISVGGWNEKSLTDDLDLSTRFHLAGWEIRFDAKVPVYEEAIAGFKALLRQRKRWAEGSLVRYLEFAPTLLSADKVSLRAKADLVAYIIEFLFPLWLLTDYAYLGLGALIGDPHRVHILLSLMLLPALGLFFYSLLIGAIHKFENVGWLATFGWAALTALYLVVVWVPTSLWIVGKLLVQKQPTFHWAKTEHHGLQQQVAS